MTATDFEFRHRLWFFWGIYLAAFLCYGFDHASAGEALVRLLVGPHRNPAQERYTLHALYGAGGVFGGCRGDAAHMGCRLPSKPGAARP